MKVKYSVIFLILFLLGSCKDDPIPTVSDFALSPGDIVVSNASSDSVALFDSDGNLRTYIFDVVNNSETVNGLDWNYTTNELMIGVDGSDRVVAISPYTGDSRVLIQNANLAGAIRGLTQLTNGQIIVNESNNVEKFSADGSSRITSGFPIAGLQTNLSDLKRMSNGGFVACSYGSDVVRTYDSDGNQTATRSSGIAGTTNAYSCNQLSDGRIVVVWDGSTDTVAIYSTDLTTEEVTYSDTSVLAAPRGVAQLENGNIVVGCAAFEHLVEIDTNGNFVRTMGSAGLADPNKVFVIPNF